MMSLNYYFHICFTYKISPYLKQEVDDKISLFTLPLIRWVPKSISFICEAFKYFKWIVSSFSMT